MYPSSDAGMGSSTLPTGTYPSASVLVSLFLPIPCYPQASVSHLLLPSHPCHFPPSLPMPLSHSYLSLSQCCSWTEYGKIAALVTHLHHSLHLHHPCRCLMRVQAQRTGQRWTHAWKAGIRKSIMVYARTAHHFNPYTSSPPHLHPYSGGCLNSLKQPSL